MRVRLSLASLLAGVAVAAAACGGGGGGGSAGGTLPAGGGVAPASAPVFISLATDFASDQWSKATTLAKQFPSAPELLARIEKQFKEENIDFARDVKPAVGPEVDVVFVDLANGGNDVVLLTKPRDKAKLESLLANGSQPPARAEIDGWTVLADAQAKIDLFRKARTEGSLANNREFRDTMQKLPQEALARVYVAGNPVQAGLDRALAGGGAAPGATQRFGTLSALALAAVAEDNGIRLDGNLDAAIVNSPDSYEAQLPSELPGGALLFVSFNGLDRQLGQALRAVEDARPDVKTSLAQVEAVLGLTLENDVFPLFRGEGGVAVYPSTQALPTIELVERVPDEGKARTLLDRIGSIAQAAGQTIRDVDISGVQAHELQIQGQSFSIFYAVFDGKLVVTNTREGIAGLRSSGPRLADDPLYKETGESARLPDETVGYVYANLREGLPYAFDLARSRGSTIPDVAEQNARPLDAAMLFGSKDEKRYRLGGFVTMK